MVSKFLLLPAIILSHITGGDIATVYDITGPHWFSEMASCQSVAAAGNDLLRSGKGTALHIISIQNDFTCRRISLSAKDKDILKTQNSSSSSALH